MKNIYYVLWIFKTCKIVNILIEKKNYLRGSLLVNSEK